jgi:hypothetical protein
MRTILAILLIATGAGATSAAETRDTALNAWMACSRTAAADQPAHIAPERAVQAAFAACAEEEDRLKAMLPAAAPLKSRDGTVVGTVDADTALRMLRTDIGQIIVMERRLAGERRGAPD